jgi:Ribbon-helix-helix protein, copG family
MRTTITLDDDVAAKIKAEMRKTGASFKEVVNEMIRTGALNREKAAKQKPFVVKARPLGNRPGINYDSLAELLELTEGPDE